MTKCTNVDYPSYVKIGFKNGEAASVNGKELNQDGIMEVVSFVSSEEGVNAEDVIAKAKGIIKNDGDVTLKLFKGAVTQM